MPSRSHPTLADVHDLASRSTPKNLSSDISGGNGKRSALAAAIGSLPDAMHMACRLHQNSSPAFCVEFIVRKDLLGLSQIAPNLTLQRCQVHAQLAGGVWRDHSSFHCNADAGTEFEQIKKVKV